MLYGMIGKFGALFVTIPDPIIGGVFMVMLGMLLLCSTPPLMIIERRPNRPIGYADDMSLHVSSK